MPDTFSAKAYLVIEPTSFNWAPDKPTGCKITSVKQKRPTSLANGAVVVAITVQLPAAAFEPLKPAALIVVPEELVQHEVTAEAIGE